MVLLRLLFALIVVAFIIRLFKSYSKAKAKAAPTKSGKPKKQLSGWQKQMFTVGVFTKLSTKRFFRDRLALFFGILFPLIFLFVFGALTQNNNKVSFSVAVINQSKTPYASLVVKGIESTSIYKVDKSITNFSEAKSKMEKNQLDSAIILPPAFGEVKAGQKLPSGQIQVLYTQNNASSGQALTQTLESGLQGLNYKLVPIKQPFTVNGSQISEKSLTQFDYTFAGLLGFTVIGVGIFGPINVFPELKKQGILRRLHTTPLRVWQYFLATMFSQAITGSTAVVVQFIVAIAVFHLTVNGNYLDILIFLVLSIFMILGIGLAIGGWAKNERQAAPLANIIVFPMLFLSGTFFPRYLMPEWLQTVTNYLPLTPVIDGLRMLTTEGKNLLQIGPQLGLVLVWMVVIYVIAFRVFKWE